MRARTVFFGCSLLGFSWFFAGCMQRPFEHDVRQSYALDTPKADPQLLDLQFFTSERIVLRREQTSRRNKLTAGRVLHRKDRKVDEIVIPAGTPGVAVAATEETITVAFSRNAKLVFERRLPDDDTDPEQLYFLRHSVNPEGQRIVEVDGRAYRVDRRGANAALMFAEWSLTRLHKRRRILPGRRIPMAG